MNRRGFLGDNDEPRFCVQCKIAGVGDPELGGWHKLNEGWYCRDCWAKLLGQVSQFLGEMRE